MKTRAPRSSLKSPPPPKNPGHRGVGGGSGEIFRMPAKCLQCAGALLPGPDNWLCPQHLHARAAAAGLTEPVVVAREADIMRALVFDVPAACGRDEFIARVYYAMNTLGSNTREADLGARHGAPMRVSHRSTRGETRDFVCSLFEFVYRNAHVSRLLVDSCASRVLEWYPQLICTASLAAVMKSERMIHAVRHELAGRVVRQWHPSDFFIFSAERGQCSTSPLSYKVDTSDPDSPLCVSTRPGTSYGTRARSR